MNTQSRRNGRAWIIVQGLALLVAGVPCHAYGQNRAAPAPLFTGSTISEPPRQHERWTPPETTAPKFLTRAAATLFEQGLADPRGCEYRAIEITTGGVWSNSGHLVATHGWVLPETPGQSARFAVAWNGLVYPAVSVGEPADLERDVRAMETEAGKMSGSRVMRKGRTPSGPFFASYRNNEEGPVSLTMLHPIKACLLLRTGRADLAERVWAAGTGVPRAAKAPKVDLTQYGVSYVTLANDLAWYHFDRAVCAHMRGDDAVALADARMLTTFQAAVEAKAEAMGYARPDDLSNRGETKPYIDFLAQLPQLLADHERRARAPKRSPVPRPGTDKKARIAALIADLDEVSVRQFGQPGGVSLGESPTVQALVAEGDDAVEPLIADFERDVRLTRSVHFFRDFHRSRTIMGAHEAAYTALVGLLKTTFFGPRTTGGNLTSRGLEGRIVVANEIRTFWEKNRDIPLIERWYRTLADDVARPNEWLQAAGNIVQHENVTVIPGSTAFGMTVTTALPKGAKPKLRGETLREKKDPSVAELIAQRVRDLDPGGPMGRDGRDAAAVETANQMATMLAEWDAKAGLPVLKVRVERSAAAFHATPKQSFAHQQLGTVIAELTELRKTLGGQDELDDYAAWIRTITPEGLNTRLTHIFAPMWRNPDHPAVQAAAAALFEDPKSPWNPPVWRGSDDGAEGNQRDLFSTPLLGLASFRVLVLRALADKTEVGTIETDATGRVTVIQGNHRSSYFARGVAQAIEVSVESGRGKPSFKAGPEALPLRMADMACDALQQLEGIPRFQKQWPVSQRDEAIAATIAYLKHYGARFRETEVARGSREMFLTDAREGTAILTFDPLDHPATAAEVAEGRAIFSLEGQGAEVRRAAMPPFPLLGRWTTLETFTDEYRIGQSVDADGKAHRNTEANIEALQTGRVWQAEEVREGDRWRRYYGFAGRHVLARVPAEEIELPPPTAWRFGWQVVSSDLDARIQIVNATARGPIPFEVIFRNHHSLDALAPTELVRGAGDSVSVREGITFRLVRESDRSDWSNPFASERQTAEKAFAPEEIAPRPVRRHAPSRSTQTLAPTAEAIVIPLDLQTLFAVTQPGRYRLEITFDDLKNDDGKLGKVVHMFVVAPAP